MRERDPVKKVKAMQFQHGGIYQPPYAGRMCYMIGLYKEQRNK